MTEPDVITDSGEIVINSIEPGTNYVLTDVERLTIRSVTASNTRESIVKFTTASTIGSNFLSLPSGIPVVGAYPVWQESTTYYMSFYMGMLIFGEVYNVTA